MRITCAILLMGNMSFTEDRTSDQAILVDDRGFSFYFQLIKFWKGLCRRYAVFLILSVLVQFFLLFFSLLFFFLNFILICKLLVSVAQKICCLLGLPVSDLTKAFLKPRVKVSAFFNEGQCFF